MGQESDGRKLGGGALVVHQEVAKLREECETLRSGLVSLLVERDHLLTVTKPYLEALYLAKLGDLKLALLELQVENRRSRRRLEMMRAAVNCGQTPDMAAIEDQLDRELAEWHARLECERARVVAATRRIANLMSSEEAAELRRLFKSLARRLHPDVCADKAPEAVALWVAIQAAYSDGDLAGLRALALVADGLGPAPEVAGNVDALRSRRDELARQVVEVAAQLATIKATWPFTLMESLDDSGWVEAQRKEFRQMIEAEKDLALRLVVATAALESEVLGGR